MDAPAFPRSEADLDEWAVYADWLMTKGDRRGELIARDLSLPPVVSRDQLADFQRLANRVCHQGNRIWLGFCLGFIRSIELSPTHIPIGVIEEPDDGTLANVTGLLRSERGARIEELAFPWRPERRSNRIPRLLAALPPSCVRVVIRPLGGVQPDDIHRVDSLIPAHVTHVSVTGVYFGPVELRAQPARGAALVHTLGAHSMRIRRWTLLELQQRYGIMPVRTQLARPLAETFELRPGVQSVIARGHTSHLVCRGDRWTIAAPDELELWRNEVRVGVQPELLQHGDVLRFDDAAWRFENPPSHHVAPLA